MKCEARPDGGRPSNAENLQHQARKCLDLGISEATWAEAVGLVTYKERVYGHAIWQVANVELDARDLRRIARLMNRPDLVEKVSTVVKAMEAAHETLKRCSPAGYPPTPEAEQ